MARRGTARNDIVYQHLTNQREMQTAANYFTLTSRLEEVRGNIFISSRPRSRYRKGHEQDVLYVVSRKGEMPIRGEEAEEVAKLATLFLHQWFLYGCCYWKIVPHPRFTWWVHVYTPQEATLLYYRKPKEVSWSLMLDEVGSRGTGVQGKIDTIGNKKYKMPKDAQYMIFHNPAWYTTRALIRNETHLTLVREQFHNAEMEPVDGINNLAEVRAFYPTTPMNAVYLKYKEMQFLEQLQRLHMIDVLEPLHIVKTTLPTMDSEELRQVEKITQPFRGGTRRVPAPSFALEMNLTEGQIAALAGRKDLRSKELRRYSDQLLNLDWTFYFPQEHAVPTIDAEEREVGNDDMLSILNRSNGVLNMGQSVFTVYPPGAAPVQVTRDDPRAGERALLLRKEIAREMDKIVGTNWSSEESQRFATAMSQQTMQKNAALQKISSRLSDVLTEAYRGLRMKFVTEAEKAARKAAKSNTQQPPGTGGVRNSWHRAPAPLVEREFNDIGTMRPRYEEEEDYDYREEEDEEEYPYMEEEEEEEYPNEVERDPIPSSGGRDNVYNARRRAAEEREEEDDVVGGKKRKKKKTHGGEGARETGAGERLTSRSDQADMIPLSILSLADDEMFSIKVWPMLRPPAIIVEKMLDAGGDPANIKVIEAVAEQVYQTYINLPKTNVPAPITGKKRGRSQKSSAPKKKRAAGGSDRGSSTTAKKAAPKKKKKAPGANKRVDAKKKTRKKTKKKKDDEEGGGEEDAPPRKRRKKGN